MLGNYLDEVRKKAPLIHNITNYVTINDVANMVLACGASPIMSDEPTDIEEITSICQGLNINMGMLNPRKIESMQKAGKKSNELHHKVLLDPVGAGSSSFRTEAALNLIRDIQFDVIRGNISEIKTLAAGHGTTSGVDADEADTLTEQNLEKMLQAIEGTVPENYGQMTGCRFRDRCPYRKQGCEAPQELEEIKAEETQKAQELHRVRCWRAKEAEQSGRTL